MRAWRISESERGWVTGHEGGWIRGWSARGDQVLFEAQHVDPVFPGMHGSMACVAPSPDGGRVAFSSVEAVHVGWVDLLTEEITLTGGMLGGRMGEHARPRWNDDGTALWYTFASGTFPPSLYDFTRGEASRLERPSTLDDVRGRFAVGLARPYAALYDARAPRVLAFLSLTPTGGFLQTEAGYVAGEPEVLASLPLEQQAPDISARYDPKRVRAALAGVPLQPVHR